MNSISLIFNSSDHKHILFILSVLSLLLVDCSKQHEQEDAYQHVSAEIISLDIPDTVVDKSALSYDRSISTWTLDQQPYSGYAVRYNDDSVLIEKFGILNGKKQHEAIKFCPDGHYKELAIYHQGKLHGEKKLWSDDPAHQLIAHYQYHLGKAHGEQKKWYVTGELFKVLHLKMGKEEGIQQAFRKNGDLFANYEAKNGRIFGLKKSALCYELENEIVQNKN